MFLWQGGKFCFGNADTAGDGAVFKSGNFAGFGYRRLFDGGVYRNRSCGGVYGFACGERTVFQTNSRAFGAKEQKTAKMNYLEIPNSLYKTSGKCKGILYCCGFKYPEIFDS